MSKIPMWAVICFDEDPYPACGRVELTEEQYTEQMMNEDATWRCPNCFREAHWDDDCLSSNPSTGMVEALEKVEAICRRQQDEIESLRTRESNLLAMVVRIERALESGR